MDGSENPQTGLGLPPGFPYPWCSDYGEDEYGIFMAFTYKGIRQGFRWIPPGTFLMGSPKQEEGRYNGPSPEWQETRHQVTFASGFWLAETTCTQELWLAVMGKNPSGFRGKHRPVETVSWTSAQRFIESLNTWQPELGLKLPSEAEWEWACRAKSLTTYWFGNKMVLRHVHHGKNSKVGTLSVRSLEPNPWGLYQMHGNVEEWCQDWLGAYPNRAVSDPRGPAWGQYRVLRGGSWKDYSWFCRSADRHGLKPGESQRYIGFRLARGS